MKNYRYLLLLIGLSVFMLACNLARQVPGVTLQPTATRGGAQATPQSIRPSITPLFGGGVVVATATPGGVVIGGQTAGTPVLGVTLPPSTTRTPGTVTVSIPTGQISDFISYVFQNILVPVLNLAVGMITSSTTYLWQMAGAQGGWTAQIACCILPIILALVYLLGGRRRRRGRFFGLF